MQMPIKDIEERVIKVIAGQTGMDEKDILLGARFKEDLNLDSLDAVALVLDIEQDFDIMVPDSDLELFTTLEDVVNYLYENLARNGVA